MRKHLPKLITLIAASTVSGWLFASDHGERGPSLPAVDHKAWRAECGSCHIAYHPALLPERSWRKLMAGLDSHFGENASLDAATSKEIETFLAANAADRSDSRRGRKVAASIPANSTPLRISETPWFERKHDELRPEVWKRKEVGSAANCAACHKNADKGRFDENEISVPGSGRPRG